MNCQMFLKAVSKGLSPSDAEPCKPTLCVTWS